mgnify:CR=1 FL=1
MTMTTPWTANVVDPAQPTQRRTPVPAWAEILLVIATFCGLAFGLSGLALPVPVATFGNLLADAAAPCALFALGATLAGRKLGEGKTEVGTVSALKLLVHL